MKKALLAALAAALILAAGAASASAPLTVQEIVEQTAVPLATANDTEAGIRYDYSAEDLAEIVRVLNENGIMLPENGTIMQMVRNGHGFYEETTLSQICEQAFGRDTGWTLEELDWFDEQLMRIGCRETHVSLLPGPDNMTREKAEGYALETLGTLFGRDLQLQNREVWKLQARFLPADEEEPLDRWSFLLQAKDADHATYSITFADKDPHEVLFSNADEPDWSKPYSGDELESRFIAVYSTQEKWDQPVWRQFHELLLQAALDPTEFMYEEYRAIQMTDYPDPKEGEISREEAVRTARAAVKPARLAFDSAILTEYEGQRAWIVAFVIWSPAYGPYDEEAGTRVVTVDSGTGAVLRVKEEASWYEAYAPAEACEKATAEMPEATDYLQIAAEAARKQAPVPDPLDETEYRASVQGLYTRYVDFTTLSLDHGSIAVTVSQDGRVESVNADTGPLDGNNAFQRYWDVYGYFAGWDQSVWVQLGKDMEGFEPEYSIDGLVIKATRYPEESAAAIGREEAKALGIKATGQRTAQAHSCVLVDAEPHPVWVLRIITSEAGDPVIGIDAETGETVFTETYVVDETPSYVTFSLPETWRKVEKSLYED